MPIKYATVDEFTAVYSLKGVSSADINDTWLPHGALRVNEELAGAFTVPFSSNNYTAKDLSIHFGYLGLLMRTRKQDDSPELREYLQSRVAAMVSSGTPMMTDSGDAIYASNNIKNEFWSSRETHKPVFDMRDAEQERVDPDLITDLNQQDT